MLGMDTKKEINNQSINQSIEIIQFYVKIYDLWRHSHLLVKTLLPVGGCVVG